MAKIFVFTETNKGKVKPVTLEILGKSVIHKMNKGDHFVFKNIE